MSEKNRERALLAYLQNPKICKQCNSFILPSEGQQPGVARRKTFCSRACAAACNNQRYPKRKPEGSCEECGVATVRRRTWCSSACKTRTFDRRRREQAEKTGKYKGRYVVHHRQKMKVKAVEYKGGKCVMCGYDRCIRALKFHHLDPSQKRFGIGSGDTMTWQKMKAELDKCILVCGNCHDEIHEGLISLS